ncbi:TPA: hypothetical protein ACK3Q6_004472 [Burkholderia cepacia]
MKNIPEGWASVGNDHDDSGERRQTNVEFITDLMEHSKYGPMAQMFVIEALAKYSKAVAEAKPESIGAAPFINSASWQAVAREIHEKVEARYNRVGR